MSKSSRKQKIEAAEARTSKKFVTIVAICVALLLVLLYWSFTNM